MSASFARAFRVPTRRLLAGLFTLAFVIAGCQQATTAHAKTPTKATGASVTFNNRIVSLDGGIGHGMIKQAQAKMLQFDAQSDAPIWVLINSGGGSVEAGLIFIDTMNAMRSPVKCLVESKAYSMAAIILVFCNERYMLPHATLMLHEASYGTSGEDPQNRARLDFLTRYLDGMHVEIAGSINMPLKSYRARIRDAWWILASEAKREGIVDDIVTGMTLEPSVVTHEETKETTVRKTETPIFPADTPQIPKRR